MKKSKDEAKRGKEGGRGEREGVHRGGGGGANLRKRAPVAHAAELNVDKDLMLFQRAGRKLDQVELRALRDEREGGASGCQ